MGVQSNHVIDFYPIQSYWNWFGDEQSCPAGSFPSREAVAWRGWPAVMGQSALKLKMLSEESVLR